MGSTQADQPPAGPASPGLTNRLRHALGFRQTFAIAGVRYREISAEPLRHALSRKGAGQKAFDVLFRDGSTMRITATARRIYADLSEPRLLPLYQRCEPYLLPGMRALILEGGTGYPGAWAAGRVAPSGAVVLVDRDTESISFAQKRYAGPNISFEAGGPESLSGETDGSFNAVFAVDAIADDEHAEASLRELWRVVAPGGWLMAARPAGDRAAALIEHLAALGSAEDAGEPLPLGDGKDGWMAAILTRPAPQ